MLDTLWQAWKGFLLDTAELSFPVQQIPYRRYSIISVMFFNRMKLGCAIIIRKSKFPQNPKRSVRFSGKGTKRSVQKRKARNTQKAETKVL